MRMADWLSYTDIEQLKSMNRYYGFDQETKHSKYELIRVLLQTIGNECFVHKNYDELEQDAKRFTQLIILDTSLSFTMEELRAKASLAGSAKPQALIRDTIKRGWLFPGYTHQTQYLFHVPHDVRKHLLSRLATSYRQSPHICKYTPAIYRDESHLLHVDFIQFLHFIKTEVVKTTHSGAIYKNQQKQLFAQFQIEEEVITKRGPRFGFGRRYHEYPDRFSFIYDYAYYGGYIRENLDGSLGLTEAGNGKLHENEEENLKAMYRFWIRLYRKPIQQLPMVIRWIGLLGYPDWIEQESVWLAVKNWLTPYFYLNHEALFQKVIKMLLHLGVIKVGIEDEITYLTLTQSGQKWMQGVSAFREREIEDHFIQQNLKQEK
ncbi:hypothetical protein IC620_04440 [Hazenella sp. IB182357]|uniref:Uncharacterized protein n=1 Tax=Polycladospora coralii TaxID=2771432 RepID=A0A926N9U2_9BACL|nr:hypothetical protein [Polycladospora coralii]MBD1371605.1 hypothetical protein [Polycladospora coralii]